MKYLETFEGHTAADIRSKVLRKPNINYLQYSEEFSEQDKKK